jgi:hypothetical protein
MRLDFHRTTRASRSSRRSCRLAAVVTVAYLGGSTIGLLVAPPLLRADGGTIRLADLVFGEYRVTVFTDPTPVTPDSLDVSFLITESRGLAVALDAEAWVEVEPLGHEGVAARYEATREQADDPRFYAAKFTLGTEGRWRIRIGVEGPRGQGTGEFEITATYPGLFRQPMVLLVAALLPLILVGAWLTLGARSEEPSGG